jgi:hypothetical protein
MRNINLQNQQDTRFNNPMGIYQITMKIFFCPFKRAGGPTLSSKHETLNRKHPNHVIQAVG